MYYLLWLRVLCNRDSVEHTSDVSSQSLVPQQVNIYFLDNRNKMCSILYPTLIIITKVLYLKYKNWRLNTGMIITTRKEWMWLSSIILGDKDWNGILPVFDTHGIRDKQERGNQKILCFFEYSWQIVHSKNRKITRQSYNFIDTQELLLNESLYFILTEVIR